jgi:hypothetical protein
VVRLDDGSLPVAWFALPEGRRAVFVAADEVPRARRLACWRVWRALACCWRYRANPSPAVTLGGALAHPKSSMATTTMRERSLLMAVSQPRDPKSGVRRQRLDESLDRLCVSSTALRFAVTLGTTNPCKFRARSREVVAKNPSLSDGSPGSVLNDKSSR